MSLSYMDKELIFYKITIEVFASDKVSIRVAEEVAFKHEITLKKEEYIDIEFLDKLNYLIFKEECMKTK